MQTCCLPHRLMVIFIVCLLASCASTPDVTGRWQRVDGENLLEFREDGTFTTVDNTGATVVGRYTLHADGTLYYTVTHTDVMQADLKPVETFAVRIAGLKFRFHKHELAVSTEEADGVEVYRRVD